MTASSAASGPDTFMQWDDDPYAVDADLTMHLVDLYFAHINNATYCMYPRNHFLHWMKNYPSKCQNERMMLYAILAAGSIFADDTLSGFGKQCARIAGDAVSSQVGRFNMAMAQTEMLLGLYHFARGSTNVALDLLGSAIRTVICMRLHTEKGCLDSKVSESQSRVEFVLSWEQLAECKRRTFWSVFLMDRYCGTNMCMIKPEDTFVRLPCTDDMYDRSIASDAPYFANGIIDPSLSILTPASPLCAMAWLVLVAAIWGDVVDFLARAPHRAASAYGEGYSLFYNETWNRLQGWYTRLPAHLQYSEANLDQSIQQAYAGTFISMHTLYHLSQMKLNRYLRHSLVPQLVSRNIRVAHSHSHQMLQMMNSLRTARRGISTPAEGQPPAFLFSTQFPGYATLSAIDIVGAGDWEPNFGTTINEIEGALDCLRELSTYWRSSKEQLRACEKKFYQIKNIVTYPAKARSGAWLGQRWGTEKSIDQEFGDENDCIYGLGDSNEAKWMYFDALQKEEGIAKAHAGGLRIA